MRSHTPLHISVIIDFIFFQLKATDVHSSRSLSLSNSLFLSFTITIKTISLPLTPRPPHRTPAQSVILISPRHIFCCDLFCLPLFLSSCMPTHLYFLLHIHLPQWLRCFSFVQASDLSVSSHSSSSGEGQQQFPEGIKPTTLSLIPFPWLSSQSSYTPIAGDSDADFNERWQRDRHPNPVDILSVMRCHGGFKAQSDFFFLHHIRW